MTYSANARRTILLYDLDPPLRPVITAMQAKIVEMQNTITQHESRIAALEAAIAALQEAVPGSEPEDDPDELPIVSLVYSTPVLAAGSGRAGVSPIGDQNFTVGVSMISDHI